MLHYKRVAKCIIILIKNENTMQITYSGNSGFMFENADKIFTEHNVTVIVISTTEDKDESITEYVVEVQDTNTANRIGAEFESKDESDDLYGGWY